jgi:hypothetical protein
MNPKFELEQTKDLRTVTGIKKHKELKKHKTPKPLACCISA